MQILLLDHFASWASLGTTVTVTLLLRIGVIPKSVVSFADRAFRSIANRRSLLLILIPVASLAVNATIAIKNGIPRARVQDEFGYLLAADTFSHGRLTNPTPPFWEHFETPHELMQPTYMSKYPPGQGLVLALGQVTIGMPIFGIWFAAAAACGAIYWMLLGFVSRPWALLGGIAAAIHPLLIHWSQIYWGGSVAMFGGALVLGAWIRLMARPAGLPAIILAVGLIILADSRPFEGLVLATPLLLVLIWQRRKNPKLLIPLASILIPGAVMMGYYNFRITGHALRMPFQEYSRQYDVYPKFWFLPKQTQPVYHNDSMRLIHTVFERGDYELLRTPISFLRVSLHRLWLFLIEYADPWILMLPLFAAIFSIKDVKYRWIWATCAFFLLGMWTENFFLPHYAAPITAGIFLLIILGWQQLFWWSKFGATISRAIAIGFIVGAAASIAAPVDFDSQRVGQLALIDQAAALQSGKHLIFVRYGPGHLMHDEWVYNSADLNSSRIIWARQLGTAADSPVAKYYADRSVWLLTVGKDDLYLNAYALPH